MKNYTILLLLIAHCFVCKGQDSVTLKIDSLTRVLNRTGFDTARLTVLEKLALQWQYKDVHKSTEYVEQAYALTQKLNLKDWSMGLMYELGFNYMLMSEHLKAIDIFQKLIRLVPKDGGGYQTATAFLGLTYKDMGDYETALAYLQEAFELNERLQKEGRDYDPRGYLGGPINLAEVFEKTNRLDSALYYAEMSYKRLAIDPAPMGEISFQWEIPWTFGVIESSLNREERAAELYFQGLKEARKQGYNIGIESVELSLARHYDKLNRADSAIWYATHAFESARKTPTLLVVSEAGFLLKKLYEQQKNPTKALYYSDLAHIAKDNLVNVEKVRQVQALTLKEERQQQALEAQRLASESRLKQYGLGLGLVVFSLIALFLYRNNRQKQALNAQLMNQKREIETLNDGLEHKVEERTAELQEALNEVKTAFSKGQTTERKRVSADLHDEIGSALSSIAIFSDVTKLKASKTAPELVPELDRIGLKSRDMIQTMRDTIWSLNDDNAQSVWERMYLSCSETLAAKNIVLDWQVPSEEHLTPLSFMTKRNVFLAFKEAINNIVKHAEATHVHVEWARTEKDCQLTIADNGKGFDTHEVAKKGNGLHNFDARMREIGGISVINSRIGGGTTIVLEFSILSDKCKVKNEK
jgi:signal transduction histidine kinase